MTNPDREELVKLADDLDSFAHDMREDANDATALWLEQRIAILRRLASSDGEVKVRELEWTGRNADGSIHIAYDGPVQYWAWELAGCGYWSWGALAGRKVSGGLDAAKAAAQADYEARIRSALVDVPAPPADAGMREALGKICIYRVEGDASIHLLVDGEKIGAFGQHTSRAMALLRLEACLRDACIDAALTAPGATTKSDGTAGKADPRGNEPLGKDTSQQGAEVAPGPSDPSSTRSEVTVCPHGLPFPYRCSACNGY